MLTNCTYLSLLFLPNYFFNIPNFIYLLLEIGFFYCIAKKLKPTIALFKNTFVYYLITNLIIIN